LTAYEFGVCEVSRLRFDPQNPRLPPDVDGHDDDEILDWMLADAGLIDLMNSIGGQGYFPGDPLLVSPVSESKRSVRIPPIVRTDWFVVEGNRRLAALRLLADPAAAPRRHKAVERAAAQAGAHDFSEVPVIAFAHRDEVLTYLGFRHITGVKEWDPLEKARFLTQLRERAMAAGAPYDNRTLARQIGSTGPYVGRLLVAFQLISSLTDEGFFGSAGVDDVPFSLLALALNYDTIVDFLGLDRPDDPGLGGLRRPRLKQLASWLFNEDPRGKTALEDSRNMKLLARVVTSRDAVALLKNGASIRNAALRTETPDALLGIALEEAASRMNVAAEQAQRLNMPVPGARQLLRGITDDAATVRTQLDKLAKSRGL
jgi:hypothetical protein